MYAIRSYYGEFAISKINAVDGKISNNTSIKYVPIINEDQIIGLVIIGKINGEVTCNIGKFFSEELNNVVHNSNFKDNFNLVSCESDIFVVNDKNICQLNETQIKVPSTENVLNDNLNLQNIMKSNISKNYESISTSKEIIMKKRSELSLNST